MEFILFIERYWQYLSVGLIVLIDLIILIVKKTKVAVSLPSNSYSQLVDLVNEAENVFGAGHGKEKLNYVVESYIKKNDIKYFDSEVGYFVKGVIEKILSTPHKKGGSYGETKDAK